MLVQDHLEKRKRVRKYELLVQTAIKYRNTKYVWGGNSPAGFDCSGFTSYVFNAHQVALPRTSTDQAKAGRRIRKRKARKGDLIFFRGSDAKKRKVGHVGIVISEKREPIRFIHASSRGVVVNNLSDSYYAKRFRKVRRIRGLRKKIRIDK